MPSVVWMNGCAVLPLHRIEPTLISFALCCSAAKLRAATTAWIIFSTGHIIYIKFSLTSSEKFSLNPLQFTISKYLLSTFKGQEIISLEIKRPLFIGVDLRKINSFNSWMSERVSLSLSLIKFLSLSMVKLFYLIFKKWCRSFIS